MLLSFFRINDPYRLLGLLVILMLIAVPGFIYPPDMLLSELKSLVLGEAIAAGKLMYIQVFDDTPPLASALFGLMHLMFGRSLLACHIIAVLLIFFQAAYFATLLISNKAYTENTYLPALIFGLLCFVSFDLVSFSPELLASTVLLFAINHLFHEIEFKIQQDVIVLKLGVYLGLSTFLVFSYWVFLFLSVFILIALTRAGFRKIMLMIFGFGLPHALLITLYYYWGEFGLLWRNFYVSNLTLSGEMLMSVSGLLVLCSVPLIYFLFSIFMVNREARFTKYQSQLMQVMFLWLLFSLIQTFVARQVSPASLITFIPPLTYFISHYLLLIRRRWRAETMLWLFLFGILSMNSLARKGRIQTVDYAALFPGESGYEALIKDKKVMMLTDGWGIYRQNALGGIFLNWDLSRKIFENLDQYQNVETVASSFATEEPDIIVDENNYMESAVERIPYLKSKYRKEGKLYLKISS